MSLPFFASNPEALNPIVSHGFPGLSDRFPSSYEVLSSMRAELVFPTYRLSYFCLDDESVCDRGCLVLSTSYRNRDIELSFYST